MPITNPREKSVHELADVYDAEHQFLEAMQRMHDNASDGTSSRRCAKAPSC